jgi:hypothetical protein
MTRRRRLESIETDYWRRQVLRYCPPGYTPARFLDAAIAWLEMPIEAQHASMPQFSNGELQTIRSWLPQLKRVRLR